MPDQEINSPRKIFGIIRIRRATRGRSITSPLAKRMPIQMIHNVNLIELIGPPAIRFGFGVYVKPCGAKPCSYRRQRTVFPLAFQSRRGDPAVHQKSQLSI